MTNDLATRVAAGERPAMDVVAALNLRGDTYGMALAIDALDSDINSALAVVEK